MRAEIYLGLSTNFCHGLFTLSINSIASASEQNDLFPSDCSPFTLGPIPTGTFPHESEPPSLVCILLAIPQVTAPDEDSKVSEEEPKKGKTRSRDHVPILALILTLQISFRQTLTMQSELNPHPASDL